LVDLRCNNNQLICLSLKNGFNGIFTSMNAINNINLSCIQVDDEVIATGYSGWFKDATAQYNNYCAPTITSFTPTSTCSGGAVTITGCNLNLTTAINFGSVAAASFIINSSTTITAIVGAGTSGNVQVISPGGTATLAGFTLSQLSAPASLNITASANDICPGTSVTFTAVPLNVGTTPTFQWKLNGANVGGNSLIFNANSFTNGDKINCVMNTIKSCPNTTFVNSDTIIMIVKPIPEISFNPSNPSISFGNSVQLNATVTGSAVSYLWTPASGLNNPSILNPVASPAVTTIYNLNITSANNCTTDKKIKVTVFKDIYIPNSFSPNGDGLNDIFRIPPGLFLNLQSFIVYNRYGNEIFKTADINKGWDGIYKGVKSPAGNYTYLIKGSDVTGDVLLKGSILIIR
jgi:gliding motility-associated-like protein